MDLTNSSRRGLNDLINDREYGVRANLDPDHKETLTQVIRLYDREGDRFLLGAELLARVRKDKEEGHHEFFAGEGVNPRAAESHGLPSSISQAQSPSSADSQQHVLSDQSAQEERGRANTEPRAEPRVARRQTEEMLQIPSDEILYESAATARRFGAGSRDQLAHIQERPRVGANFARFEREQLLMRSGFRVVERSQAASLSGLNSSGPEASENEDNPPVTHVSILSLEEEEKHGSGREEARRKKNIKNVGYYS